MKKVRPIIAIATAVCIVAVTAITLVLPNKAKATGNVSMNVAFVDDSGQPIEQIGTRKYVWLQLSVADYNVVGNKTEQDYTSAIDSVVAYVELDTSVFSVSTDNQTAVVASPYMTEINAAQGCLDAAAFDGEIEGVSVILDAAQTAGDYCITKAELDEHNGVLMSVRLDVRPSTDSENTACTANVVDTVENFYKTSATLLTTATDTWSTNEVYLTAGNGDSLVVSGAYDNGFTIDNAENVQTNYVLGWSTNSSASKVPTDAEINANKGASDWLGWGFGVALNHKVNGIWEADSKAVFDEALGLGMIYTNAADNPVTNGYYNAVSTSKYALGDRFEFSFTATYTKKTGTAFSESVGLGGLAVVIKKESTGTYVCLEYAGVEVARSATSIDTWANATAYSKDEISDIWDVITKDRNQNGGIDLPLIPFEEASDDVLTTIDLRVCFDNGVVTVYKHGGEAICSADLGALNIDYDFSNSRINVKFSSLNEKGAAAAVVGFEWLWDNADVIEGASLTLDSDIALNFYTNELSSEYDSVYMMVDDTAYEGQKLDSGHVVKYTRLSPRKLTDTVNAEFYGKKNGETDTYLGSLEYSAERYIYQLLNTSEDSFAALGVSADKVEGLKKLLVELLYYGASAQKYFGYNTDKLVTRGLELYPALMEYTDSELFETSVSPSELGVNYDLVLDTATNAKSKIKWSSVGLEFKDTIALRFKIKATPADVENLKVFANGVETDKFRLEGCGVNTYYLYYSGAKLNQMKQPVTITLYNAQTRVSTPITYSVQSYAYNALTKFNDEATLNALVTSIIHYGEATVAYVS